MHLIITRRRQAKRLTLRLSPKDGSVQVSAPRRVREVEILRFVEKNQDWIEWHRQALPARIPFTEGAVIPVQDEPHRLVCSGALRGSIERRDGVLSVPCLPEHLPRRVRDYLIREAKTALAIAVAEKAHQLGIKPPPFAVRDTRSRWGSCSPSGALSFSWRLILAPPPVLDYVAAHEVAHLKHMDHGPDFWALCDSLTPHFTLARPWLSQNGHTLWRYG